MITRIWQGWTSPENADAYEQLLTREIFPGIQAKTPDGLLGFELLRRSHNDEVEFMTVYRFADVDSIRAMTGGTQSEAYVPQSAQAILKRFETTARHFELRHSFSCARDGQ